MTAAPRPRWHELRVGGRLMGRYCPALRRLELWHRGSQVTFDLRRFDAMLSEQGETVHFGPQPPDDGWEYVEAQQFGDTEMRWVRAWRKDGT